MDLFRNLVLMFFLVASSVLDLRIRKIPNILTGPIIMTGLILFIIEMGIIGVWISFFGFLIGILLFLVPFMMGGMGAGDVKMLGAIGSLMGAQFVFRTGLFAALSGGVIALFYMIYKLGFIGTLVKLFGSIVSRFFQFIYIRSGKRWFGEKSNKLRSYSKESKNLYIPYAIPISIGSVLAYLAFII